MKATVRTFQSGCGDCIFLILEDTTNGDKRHIMIDCGRFTSDIKLFVKQDLGMKLDILIVSHYDDDHIAGVIDMLSDIEFKDLYIGKILYNCFQDYDSATAKRIQNDNKELLDKYAANLKNGNNSYGTKISAPQASCLCLLLRANEKWFLGWERHILTEGETVRVDSDSKWGELYVLSPSCESLAELKHDFVKEYVKCVHELPPQDSFENQDAYWEMLLRITSSKSRLRERIPVNSSIITKRFLEKKAMIDPDESGITPPNKASLALIWECNGKKILLGGDAIASQLYKAISNRYSENQVWFEAIKIPHHGSKNNMSNVLSSFIDSEHYFLTGGKKGEGPNYETLAKIILHPLNTNTAIRMIHYNRIVNLTELQRLIKDENVNLMDSCNAKLTNENEYTFEY